MKMSQAAAQLYTLSGYVESPGDIVQSLRRVRAMGYQAVQVSKVGPIDTKELALMLEGEGLICCATHEPSEAILAAPEAVAEKLHLLDCLYTAYPYPAGVDFGSEESLTKLIADLTRAGQVLRASGLTLCYHNHQIEFQKLGGKIALERIFDETDPADLQAELDVYWVQYGGGDPVAWARNLAGREPLIHLKDYKINADNKPHYADLGAGTLNLPEIIRAAEQGGCKWFIVERDPSPGDPFDSLKASYEYLERVIAEPESS